MTATQAPTPGPLSAEDWASLADLHTLKGWLHGVSLTPDWNDVVADGGVTVAMVVQQEAGQMASRVGRVIDNFHLAPAAPVEASGSERDEKLKRAYEESSPFLEIIPDPTVEGCHRTVAHNPALRPQPSGETREDRLSAALIAMVEHFERVDAAPEDKAVIQAACEVWAGVKRDKALSTTPARAEAQDEGAAAWVTLFKHHLGASSLHDVVKEYIAQHSHPSPTPAADADRVREAIALAEYVCGLLPSLAGAADQPDNKVYAAYANKREIMGARDRLATLKAQGK